LVSTHVFSLKMAILLRFEIKPQLYWCQKSLLLEKKIRVRIEIAVNLKLEDQKI
jgi:hypothetical protein